MQNETAVHALRAKFCDLTDEEFELFIAACRLRQLNPATDHVYFKRQFNEISGRTEIRILLTIDGFRSVASETGEYRGWVGPFYASEDQENWSDVWRGKGYPYAARFGVLRDGYKDYGYRVAKWDEFAQFTEKGALLDHWDRMPSHMLGLRAEACALRAAFPERLKGVYMEGELDRPPGTARKGPTERPARPAAKSLSPEELEVALLDLGYESESERESIVQNLRRQYPLLAANNPGAFAARVAEETRPKRVVVPV